MRELTGKWYLKKSFFMYQIYVEVKRSDFFEEDFTYSPEYTRYEKASGEDILKLNIKTL